MGFSSSDNVSLKEMLEFCHAKFGDLSQENILCASGCDACTGGCEGHGMSVWDTCDIK